MSDQTYQGWANRETWCMNLWLNNDEGLYNHCRNVAKMVAKDYDVADQIAEFVDGLFDECRDSEMIRIWKDDVGSIWRVEWLEIAHGFMED